MLLPRTVAVCPCAAPVIALVAAQVLVPLNSSALARVLVPFDPPAPSTCPLATMPEGSSVAVCPCRAVVIVPADDQLPGPEAGLNITAVASVVDPLLPPVKRILPFGSSVAVCPSRADGIFASV